MTDPVPIRELSEAERALVEALPHVHRQQTAGKHRQDRMDAAEWLQKHGAMVKALRYCATALTCVLAGCAATPRTRAMQAVVVTDALADVASDGWAGFVDSEIARCQALDLPSPQERVDCLGPAADGEALAGAVASLVIVQRAIHAAVVCEESDSCAQPTNWARLAAEAAVVLKDVRAAWEAVRP